MPKSFFVRCIVVPLGILLILPALFAIVGAVQLQRVGKPGLEKTLSYVLNTKVTIESVTLDPFHRTVSILGLAVANPEEFKEGTAIRLERIVIRPDLPSFLSATPTIQEVILEKPTLFLHHEIGKGTNLNALSTRASEVMKKVDLDAPKGAQRTFVVKSLRCDGGRATLSANLIPGQSADIEIAPFTLTELSSDKPVSTAEISEVFIRTVVENNVTLKNVLQPVAERLREGIGSLFKKEDEKPPATLEEPEAPLQELLPLANPDATKRN